MSLDTPHGSSQAKQTPQDDALDSKDNTYKQYSQRIDHEDSLNDRQSLNDSRFLPQTFEVPQSPTDQSDSEESDSGTRGNTPYDEKQHLLSGEDYFYYSGHGDEDDRLSNGQTDIGDEEDGYHSEQSAKLINIFCEQDTSKLLLNVFKVAFPAMLSAIMG